MTRFAPKAPKKFKDPMLQKREREQRKAEREQRKAARQALTPKERRQKQKSALETRRAKKAAPTTGPTPMPTKTTKPTGPLIPMGFSKGGVATKKSKKKK